MKLTSPSPLSFRLPNFICEGCAEPDRFPKPPLTLDTCGIGEGDCAGEITRGFEFGMGIGADEVEEAICGELLVIAGDSVGREPNCSFGPGPPTGPPLPLKKGLLIVTEPFRL